MCPRIMFAGQMFQKLINAQYKISIHITTKMMIPVTSPSDFGESANAFSVSTFNKVSVSLLKQCGFWNFAFFQKELYCTFSRFFDYWKFVELHISFLWVIFLFFWIGYLIRYAKRKFCAKLFVNLYSVILFLCLCNKCLFVYISHQN